MQIEAVHGDITREPVDAIVNAANSSLLGGGGVDGAIHAAAGPELLEACRELRRTRYPDGLGVGDAVATPAFRLPARWVVHTVGPNRHRGETSPAMLAACFTTSLAVAVELGARSIAFPAVSAGVYGWDMAEVARVAVASVQAWLAGTESVWGDGQPQGDGIDLVRFVLFSPAARATFQATIDEHAHRA
jgi:O-acetyl-ADP-ribose deacetylase (regulator of RNase III)